MLPTLLERGIGPVGNELAEAIEILGCEDRRVASAVGSGLDQPVVRCRCDSRVTKDTLKRNRAAIWAIVPSPRRTVSMIRCRRSGKRVSSLTSLPRSSFKRRAIQVKALRNDPVRPLRSSPVEIMGDLLLYV